MKRIYLAALLGALLLAPAVQARSFADIRASGTLRLATSADFEPFNYMKGDQFAGFEVDLGNLLAKQLGLKAVWVKDNFDSLLDDFSSKNYDVVIASHAITSTRAQIVDFTQPHYCTGGVALAQPGGPLTSKAMANKVLGAESGSTYMGYIKKLPFDKQLKVYANSGEAIQAVATGNVSAVVTDKFAALQALKTYNKAKLVMGDLLWRESIGMAVEKNNTDLRQALNAALGKLLKDGQYNKLSQSYFGQDVRC
ncbi:amino acid ABC transporter substrate-binding protein [Deinococcus irradiatisoli]|uniref:Amino acid ABC transporter substrate-binding protein n=1 Tax=Deinococcus irradiatisoli TaxID=2202254 RepID=A0A2Z3JKX8_9DEIO|nr:ABC transporter substrate-binding protein [Deinococcus irradiatisoli]AWN24201.1 amino acid ABC transporter substrate-binding protein [Deinococcus irradiatisoli]